MKISSCVFSGDFLLGQQGVKKLPKVQRSIWHHHYLYQPLLASHASGIAASVSINLTFPSQHPSVFNTKIKVPTNIYFNLSSQQKGGPPFKHHGDVDFCCVAKTGDPYTNSRSSNPVHPMKPWQRSRSSKKEPRHHGCNHLQPPHGRIWVEFCRVD